MFVLLAFEAGLSMWTVRQRFEYKWKATMIVSVLVAIISPIASVLCIIKLPYNRVYSRIIGERSVFLLVYFILIFHIFRQAKCKINCKYWKYALVFNLPLIPHYLSQHILNHTDQIMIANMVGNSAAGIYSVAYYGSSAIKIFWTSINASLIPWTYEKCEKGDYQRLKEVSEVLILSFAFICVLFMFLAPEVMKILSPNEYHAGIYVIPPVVSGLFFSVMYFIFANVIYYFKQPKYVMVGSVLAAILNIVLNYYFIPKYGYIAAGYTTLISYAFQTVMNYWAMRKVMGRNIYNTKFLIFISVVIILTGLMLSLVYSNMVLRIILLAVTIACSVLYLHRNKDVFIQLYKRK